MPSPCLFQFHLASRLRGGEAAIQSSESILQNLGYMDLLSCGDSAVHRLDPRAKLVTTLVFIVAVMSMDRYAVSMLVPFASYPVYLAAAGGIPPRYLVKKIMYLAPFVLFVAAFNPVFDREAVMSIGPLAISGGWLSALSIMIRFALTLGSVITMIACTGFYNVCLALERLKVPRVLAVQLLFLYRYIFVLVEEAARMLRARDLRSFGRRGSGIGVFGPMAGTLLLRSVDRGKRIYLAMTSRGFDGTFRRLTPLRFGVRDIAFMFAWCGLFVFLRLVNVSRWIGSMAEGLLS